MPRRPGTRGQGLMGSRTGRTGRKHAPPRAPDPGGVAGRRRTDGEHRERVVHEEESGDAAVHARDLYHAHRRAEHALPRAPVALQRGAAQAQRRQARHQVVRELGALPEVCDHRRDLLLLQPGARGLVDGARRTRRPAAELLLRSAAAGTGLGSALASLAQPGTRRARRRTMKARVRWRMPRSSGESSSSKRNALSDTAGGKLAIVCAWGKPS